jgi:hypothetical protein
MSTEKFDTLDKTIEFLKTDLSNRRGKYYYRRLSIKLDGNALVLFQYEGKVIGCAIMIDQADSELVENGVLYRGFYIFDMNTMRIFTRPITAEEYRTIDSDFKSFNQSTRKTDMAYYKDISNLIKAHV